MILSTARMLDTHGCALPSASVIIFIQSLTLNTTILSIVRNSLFRHAFNYCFIASTLNVLVFHYLHVIIHVCAFFEHMQDLHRLQLVFKYDYTMTVQL